MEDDLKQNYGRIPKKKDGRQPQKKNGRQPQAQFKKSAIIGCDTIVN